MVYDFSAHWIDAHFGKLNLKSIWLSIMRKNIKKLEDFKMKYHSDLFLKISFGKQPVSDSKCEKIGSLNTSLLSN